MTKKKWFWALISLVIAVLSIWGVTSAASGFSIEQLREDFANADYKWVACAFLCMLGFIFFEGAALSVILKELTPEKFRPRYILYSSADNFFSAITPSATGGQPACALFMMRDGINGAVTTVTLLVNLTLYSVSLLLIGGGVMIIRPGAISVLRPFAKILVLIGFAVLVVLVLGLLLLLWKEQVLHGILSAVLRFLTKIRIIRKPDKWKAKTDCLVRDYKEASVAVAGKAGMIAKALLLNVLQRVSQISVAMFMYLANGGSSKYAADVWAFQGLTSVGSYCLPIPGGMGAADYLLLDGLSHVPDVTNAANLELLSRGVSFYCCVLVCGIITLIGFLVGKRREENAGVL